MMWYKERTKSALWYKELEGLHRVEVEAIWVVHSFSLSARWGGDKPLLRRNMIFS